MTLETTSGGRGCMYMYVGVHVCVCMDCVAHTASNNLCNEFSCLISEFLVMQFARLPCLLFMMIIIIQYHVYCTYCCI